MDATNNNHFVGKPFHTYQDVDIPLIPYGQPAWNGHFAYPIPAQTPPPAPQRERYTARRFLIDLASIAWIVPIAFIVYVNFKSWVVGRGVSCQSLHPSDNCFGGMFTPDRHKRVAELYEDDRAITGGLQLAAKALEIWFIAIVMSLLLSMTMRLAASPDGLPLGYLLTHISFPDLLGLVDRRLWTSWAGARRHGSALRLWGFIILVVLLCITSNLMGPATAILIIPQIGTEVYEDPTLKRFDQISAHLSPRSANMVPECNAAELAAGDFSCTKVYSSSLDEFSSGSKLRLELNLRGWRTVPLMSEHDGILFTYNTSTITTRTATESETTTRSERTLMWAPCRGALKEIAADYEEVIRSQFYQDPDESEKFKRVFGKTENPTLYQKFNNSLDITLHRISPSLGFSTGCLRVSDGFQYQVSEEKLVWCLKVTPVAGRFMIYCSPFGTGWGGVSLDTARFYIADRDNVSPSNIMVDLYMVPTTAIFNNSYPPCDGTPCDWDRIFALQAGNHPDLGFAIDSTPWQVTEYIKSSSSGHPTVVCSTETFLSFPDYVINVLPDQNPIGLVQMNIPEGDVYYRILHPDWILAAWSLTNSLNTVEATRPAAVNLVSALKSIGDPPQFINDTYPDAGIMMFQDQHGNAIFHALTFVGFSSTTITPGDADDDPERPFLKSSKTLRVYMYEMKSRTNKGAAAVCIFGCVVAFMRPIISYWVGSRQPSALRLVAAALQHQPVDSLERVQKEGDMGKVLVRVVPHTEDTKGVVLRTLDEGGSPGPGYQ